ncbi:PAS domain S-box protein [Ruficoccus amylovorans]|uniref:histidine kinase n=1 Tax=Ruficoccus amylovorans TaxID=1804625 RepID=A0A842HJR7_9BACT|nr:PAS domain S-box protein [Ruficoccus amylovorans]MBC2595401.1 PAS domain S-box protein [Ruficoccus amylovorans]
MSDEPSVWQKRLERERAARKQAERLLEGKALELYRKNQELEKVKADLKKTVQRRTEELQYSLRMLHEEEHRLADLAARFPGVIYQWYLRPNGECGFYYISPTCEETFGFTAEAALKDWTVIQIHPDDQQRWDSSAEAAISGQIDWDFEGRIITSGGVVKWMRGCGRPVRGRNEEIVFNGMMMDITPLKKAEEELRRLSLVASRTINGVVITDESGYIIWVNRAFSSITGYDISEAVGKKPGHLLQGPLTDPDTIKYISRQLLNQRPFSAELLNYHKNGNTYWLRLDVNPLFDDNGRLTNFVALETDITRQKETEEALRMARQMAEAAAREAEEANQAKSRFLANMSHEIRTPLNGILGYAQIMARRKDLSPDIKDMIRTIGRSGEHLLRLIDDILDLSKIEAGKLELHEDHFALMAFLRELEDMLLPRAEAKNIRLRFVPWDYEAGVSQVFGERMVCMDEKALRQILLNLVGNAIKFTQVGGVSIRYGLTSAGRLRFEIEDTGTGIDTSEQAGVFNAFEQAEKGRRSIGGTGLGLAISKRLCELMNGEIGLESELGTGSLFWVELPLRASDAPMREPEVRLPDISGYEGEPRRVLVVDDNVDNRVVLSDLLTSVGFEVNKASDSQEALDWIERELPDLILTDLVMPNVSGFELCRMIHEDPRVKHVPVVAVSASLMRSAENKERLMPFAAFVSKPIMVDELYREVGRLLGLTWRYVKDVPITPLPSASMPGNRPAPDTLTELLDLAELGDMLEVQRRLVQLVRQYPQWEKYYRRLESLANDFQADALAHLIRETLGGDGTASESNPEIT